MALFPMTLLDDLDEIGFFICGIFLFFFSIAALETTFIFIFIFSWDIINAQIEACCSSNTICWIGGRTSIQTVLLGIDEENFAREWVSSMVGFSAYVPRLRCHKQHFDNFFGQIYLFQFKKNKNKKLVKRVHFCFFLKKKRVHSYSHTVCITFKIIFKSKFNSNLS
jgi:hypothetical protein